MKPGQFVINVVKEKYSEWLEMAGDDSQSMLCDILGSLLAKEMDKNFYYQERIKKIDPNFSYNIIKRK